MILSDIDIGRLIQRREDPLVIDGPKTDQTLQPCSIDMTLGDEILIFDNIDDQWLSTQKQPSMHRKKFDTVSLHPQGFVLAATEQYFKIPKDHAAQVDGKSSLGRLGLFVHITAGWIDPGFNGNITLEIFNANQFPIELKAGMPIAQLILFQLSGQVARPYGHSALGSKYQDSVGVMPMKSSR